MRSAGKPIAMMFGQISEHSQENVSNNIHHTMHICSITWLKGAVKCMALILLK